MFPARLAQKVYAWALQLLPEPFRQTYAPDMATTFRERIRVAQKRSNPLAAYAVAVRETLGTVVVACQERALTRHRQITTTTSYRKQTLRERMSHAVHETQHAVRGLVIAPAFTLPAVLTLALGIGANLAIFGLIRGVVVRPLPYPDADDIVWIDHSASGINLDNGLGLTRGLYIYYGEQSVFTSVAISEEFASTINDLHGPEQIDVARVTPSTVDVLRTPPALGRWLPKDNPSSSDLLIILSDDLWARRYARDADIIGRTVNLNGTPAEVIAVMPSGYNYPSKQTDAWISLDVDPNGMFGGFNFRGVARLAPGTTPSDAQVRLNQAIPQLPQRFADPFASTVVTDANIRALVTTLKEEQVGSVRITLWVLLGSVGLVLVIACLNVTNLVLVRAETKSHETAIRTALGASRKQLLRHFFLETILFTGMGAIAGTALGWLGLKALVAANPANIPRLHLVHLDVYVLGFGAVLVALAIVVLTAVRYFRSMRTTQTLSSRGRGAASTLGADRFRQTIGVAQISIALILLIGSGLMIKTFRNIRNVDLGFSSNNVITFEIGLSRSDYATQRHAADFQGELISKLAALPGVIAVGAVSRCLPLGGWCGGDPLAVQGRTLRPGEIPRIVALRSASPAYIEAMRIPLLTGRWLEDRDNTSQNVVVVSEALANSYWPNEDPIGQLVSDLGSETPDSSWYTVVGVVRNTPAISVTDVNTPMIYFPTVSRGGRGPSVHTMRLVVRAGVPATSLVPAIRNTVASLDANVPLANVETLERIVRLATAHTTFATILLGIASTLAIVLGTIGVYAIISYSVASRQSEIGIRLALGARRSDVNLLIMRYAGLVAVTGCLIGLLGAVALSRFVEGLLYQVSPTDVVIYVLVAGAMLTATLVAGFLPARRASGVNPTNALRG